MSNKEELTLFSSINDDGTIIEAETLEIINCAYLSATHMTWQDLFEGFDEMYAITFSSGIDFTSRLLSRFEYVEIIYGCPDIINSQIATIIAAQAHIIEIISKSKSIKTISKMVADNQLRLFVSRDTNSHEKIFILKALDGRTRVITGSANMSASAFNGIQREEIMCFDDENAFNYFMNRFEKLKEKCSDRIYNETIKAVVENKSFIKEHIEKTPILEEAKKQIQIDITKTADDVDYVADIKNLAKEIKNLLPKYKVKQNTISITADMVSIIRKNNRDFIDRTSRERQLPILHLDINEETLSFNKKSVDLNPDTDKIRSDIDSIIGFLDGFNQFNGKVRTTQKDFFSYLNWFFATIFIPELRLTANRYKYSLYYFPIFGILCGPSNAGKTKLVELLSKLMTNESIIPSGSDVFSSREIEKLRSVCEGVPIMIEDLAKTQYENNYEKIIKDDYYGMTNWNTNYSAVSITANKIQSLTQDATKRAVYFRTDISTDKETGARNAKLVNDMIGQATNALFCEYVRRMIPIVKRMENKMMDGITDYAPDILKESSLVLVEIIKENRMDIPDYVRVVSYKDYFGESVVGRTAIEKIQTAWKHQKSNFNINKRENKLSFSIPESSSYEIGYLVNELPISLNAKKLGGMLTMDLDKAKEVFGITFKKSIFDK